MNLKTNAPLVHTLAPRETSEIIRSRFLSPERSRRESPARDPSQPHACRADPLPSARQKYRISSSSWSAAEFDRPAACRGNRCRSISHDVHARSPVHFSVRWSRESGSGSYTYAPRAILFAAVLPRSGSLSGSKEAPLRPLLSTALPRLANRETGVSRFAAAFGNANAPAALVRLLP